MMENNDSDSFNPSDYSGDENSVQQAVQTKVTDGAGDVANPLGELERPQIICVIGGPGVGKGTQCKKLADDLSAAHLSVGDLLRAEASRVLAEEGTDIVAIMEDGKLVPKELVQEVLKRYVDQKVQQGITRILLDGFPRSMDQMTLFESSGFKIKAVLFFQGSRKTLLDRVRKRAKTSGRVDDNDDTFDKRYQGFLDESPEIIRSSKQKKILWEVDCNRELGVIYEETMELVKHIFSG